MMTIPEILKELEPYTGKFPMEAMKAAVEQREAITPELLRILEAVAENPAEFAKREHYMAHMFAMYLLAQFRETRAYPLLVKMFSAPGETSYDLAGDTVTEGLSSLLASVYDGNPALLMGLIENAQANEYVRVGAMEALLILERNGLMTRTGVIDYFRSLFHGKLERAPSFAWDGLIMAVADMPAPELLDEVRQAYAGGLVDPNIDTLEGAERRIRHPDPEGRERNPLISDAIEEMEWWACFHDDDFDSVPDDDEKGEDDDVDPALLSDPELPPPTAYAPAGPFVREGPKVGRNDPCPCGSGKKYKKCCGK
jgi:hypothetical protein